LLLLLNRAQINIDDFVKSPSAALRFTFVAAAYTPSTPHASGFARLASGAFYFAIHLMAFYEIIKYCNVKNWLNQGEFFIKNLN